MHRFREIIRTALSPVRLLDNEMNAGTREILAASVKDNTHWLDLGCGLKPFASSFNHAHYIGIDIEVSGRSGDMKVPDKYFDGINIPYEDNTFDGVLCTQVLEHVENLDLLLAECNRVIKMGGSFVVSVPFLYREHEQPYDFRRFTSYGLMLAMARNGFQVSTCLKCLSAIETIATIFSVYISNNIGNKNKFAFILCSLFINLPALILSKYLAKILPDSRDLFCVLISSAIKTVHLKG
jgi:ubiquinone/menaquinone biosynthesis C-methylase UbiE